MALIDQLQALPAQWETMLRDRFLPLKGKLLDVIERAKTPVDSSYAFSCKLMQQGNFAEAKLRLKFVLWRRPQFADAWYNLSVCHFALSQKYEGLNALNRSLALNPMDEMALYLKASYENGQYAETFEPHSTPLPMVMAEFNPIAHRYTLDQLEAGYRGHLILSELIASMSLHAQHMLELGCGTGLCGLFIAPFAEKLIGIDASRPMLERIINSERDNPYADLLVGDLRDYLLADKQPQYDVIVGMNVLPVVGGLAPVMDGVARSLQPGGHFIFSTLILPAAEGYNFLPEIRRFAHSNAYLQAQIERAGLTLVSQQEVRLYDHSDELARLTVVRK